jgi:orotate phosphoribosyltransferase
VVRTGNAPLSTPGAASEIPRRQWEYEKATVLGRFSASINALSVREDLKETGVSLRLFAQRIKNNGKTVQGSGVITDCESACGENRAFSQSMYDMVYLRILTIHYVVVAIPWGGGLVKNTRLG